MRNQNKLRMLQHCPTQKKIIKYLAENGKQTRNEVTRALGTHQKSTYEAFGSLVGKGFIGKYDEKKYLNRKYDQYWLSLEGISVAIKLGADWQKLKMSMEQIFGRSEGLDGFFELTEDVGIKKMHTFMKMFRLTEKGLEFIMTSIPTMKKNEAKKILKAVTSKYPIYRKAVKKSIKELEELL